MKIRYLAEQLGMCILTDTSGEDKELTGVYIGDLLSWVMSHADKGDLWITVHTHTNIVAVALLAEIACIVIPEDIKVEEETIKKANEEGIPILSTSMNSYEISCGIHGIMSSGQS